MTDDEWEVLLPATIDPSGPDAIADVATFTAMDDYPDRAALRADIDRFEAIIVRVSDLPADLLDAATNLQVVAKHGAGLDNVDVEAATRNGVVVANTPGANSRAVAEHAMTLLLAVRRNVLPADRAVRGGDWERHRFEGRELGGDTLGLLGFGDVARETAGLARGFDADVVTYDPFVPAESVPEGVEMVAAKADLFERADAVSVHTPLTPETRGAVSTAELDALGSDGVLVNTSRGGVVDEAALVDALESGVVAGAGIDVFATEPPADDHPLLDREDVVLTPHLGGLTRGAMERMSRRAAANVRTVRDGGIPESAVNAERL
ncbi:hydroxyacid dehydrogenase [Haloplanus halophilus]|uniref:hydroxyacid dehydrogenase n=1 Tax=Haloplanus halophilus TaxID=2949993 RepID=UPI00203EB004|nr:hydroxyacid dehydrogenase [Haloplanus sp. GDY1]